MSQMQRKTKTDKMSKLRREIEFLKRGMCRVRNKLDRLQQDIVQTPAMSIIDIRSKQLIDQQDNHDNDQGRIQAGHDNDACVDPYPTIEQQMWAVAILSRQLHEKEHIQFRSKWISKKITNQLSILI